MGFFYNCLFIVQLFALVLDKFMDFMWCRGTTKAMDP